MQERVQGSVVQPDEGSTPRVTRDTTAALPRDPYPYKEATMRLGALIGRYVPPHAPPTVLAEEAKRYAGEGFDSVSGQAGVAQ
jgi:hypothetical protein